MMCQPEGERIHFGTTVLVWSPPRNDDAWGVRIPQVVLDELNVKLNKKGDFDACVRIYIRNSEIIISLCNPPKNYSKDIINRQDKKCRELGVQHGFKIKRGGKKQTYGWVKIIEEAGSLVGLQPKKDYRADIYTQGCWIILTNFREICQCEKS